MISIETFQVVGGPLAGETMEIHSEDVMHPHTVEIRLSSGHYERSHEGGRRFLVWRGV